MKTSLLLVLTASMALWVGCQTGGSRPPVNTAKYNLESQAKFVLMDSATQRSVTSPALQERPLDDGRLEVVAKIRNRLSRRIQVQVNCEFKDEQGFTVDSTPWEPLILTENATENVRFVSMNNKAKDYTVRVRQYR